MDFEEKCFVAMLITILILVVVLVIKQEADYKKYKEWYQTLPVEEQQAIYESNIERYEVLGVHKYVRTSTNQFGGVSSIDICYSFTYLNGGTLCSQDNFYPTEYGSYKLAIGDEDLYIINHNDQTTHTLQLTRETLENMQGLN